MCKKDPYNKVIWLSVKEPYNNERFLKDNYECANPYNNKLRLSVRIVWGKTLIELMKPWMSNSFPSSLIWRKLICCWKFSDIFLISSPRYNSAEDFPFYLFPQIFNKRRNRARFFICFMQWNVRKGLRHNWMTGVRTWNRHDVKCQNKHWKEKPYSGGGVNLPTPPRILN